MQRKVTYSTIQRAKKDQNGIKSVSLKLLVTGAMIPLGTVERTGDKAAGFMHTATSQDDHEVGKFTTLPQAGEALRKHYDASVRHIANADASDDDDASVEINSTAVTPSQRMLSMEDAAQELCGGAKNPMAALKKRISRGAVTVQDGMVVLS